MNLILGLLLLGLSVQIPLQQNQFSQPEIATISFCEMVKHPAQYFDKTIRITAAWELGEEGSNLNNVRCVRSHDDSIGVGFAAHSQGPPDSIRKATDTIMSGKAGPQPRVTVVGILRNASRHDFAWYRYRFDIVRFEEIKDDITERIGTYDGTLREGLTYRASVQADKIFRLSFESPLRLAPHHAVHLEWTNLDQFPVLANLRSNARRQIVFRVVADQIQRISELRWNRSLRLEIQLVE